MMNIFFLLILFSSLLGRIKFPGLNIGIHYLLLPAFSSGIIFWSLKDTVEIIKKNKIILLIFGMLYLWMWVCSLSSPFPVTAITYSIKYTTYFILFITFLVLTYREQRNSSLNFYYRCILYLLQIIAVLGFLEALVPNHWIFELLKFPSFYPQIGSIMQNPNQFGVIMGIGLCLSLILEKRKKISEIELYISEFLFLVSLALSASRNAWLIFIFGIILLFLYKIVNLKQIIFLLSAWFLCIVTIPVSTYRIGLGDSKIFPLINLFLPNPSAIVLPSPVGTALSRFALWHAAIAETIKRPLTGIGIGVFAEHIGVKVFGAKGFHAHNIFLNVLVELGITGLFIFTSFLVTIASKVKHTNPITTIPIMMFLASQIPDFFAEDYTFTTIEFYFLAAAINSRKDFVMQSSN
ncbi:MAG: O-antigen ligase family protein [Nostoc sp. ChiSLP02]|nr:O-antigen ligase family protein [Nostoc sp. DedSLP05]MDZ8098754.1 O-antigen ligase family protein [Nostoc sp. DedSLP01]MDZ8183633.1 O-antigen ligase family protein [Nostoc sp. ChiSLP02]